MNNSFGKAVIGVAIVAGAMIASGSAQALPSFAVQTGQPCAACHVGAMGPQLRQYGRDFKLYGYTGTDTKDHGLPITISSQMGASHSSDQGPNQNSSNDNLALNEVAVYYGGKITKNLGAFVQGKYYGVERRVGWDASDIRYVKDGSLFGEDLVMGLTVNNQPGTQDIWNSAPAWGFPYVAKTSRIPTPVASTLLDNGLALHVAGAGLYASWNNLVYLEADGYKNLSTTMRSALGDIPSGGVDRSQNISPYWRAALEHEIDNGRYYMQLGTTGLVSDIYPGGVTSAGSDHYVDNAIDANFQWVVNPKNATSDVLSAHSIFINEKANLSASQVLNGTNAKDSLRTFRTDVSYSFGAMITPTLQYFQTQGGNDMGRYGTLTGSPNSAGWVGEIAYSPWGRPDSSIQNANARLTLSYTGYTKFNGSTDGARNNNTILLNLTIAYGANGSMSGK